MFLDAKLTNADVSGAKSLTCEQIKDTKNPEKEYYLRHYLSVYKVIIKRENGLGSTASERGGYLAFILIA